MRKVLFAMAAVIAVLCVSCTKTDDGIRDTLLGTWVIANEGSPATSLTFNMNNMTVSDGTADRQPFGVGSEVWSYFVSSDSVLHISQEYYDGDETSSISYTLPLSFGDQYNTVYLTYKKSRKKTHTYTFIRR